MANWQKVRGIIFDLFHTLVSLEVAKAPGQSTPQILGIDPDVWYQHWLKDPPDYVLGLVPVEVPIKRLAQKLNPAVREEQIQEALRTRHERFRHTLLNIESETLDGMRQLRSNGYRIGLISNCGFDEIASWDESPLAPLFDIAVFSCKVKLKKPDKEIYLYTAEKLGLAPPECLYVGNGGSDELTGAERAGMTPVLLTRHLEAIRPAHITKVMPFARIYVRTVSDLKVLLDHKRILPANLQSGQHQPPHHPFPPPSP
ncbi:MAG: HAD family hydrolase [candidate division WOR-3 bacterium]